MNTQYWVEGIKCAKSISQYDLKYLAPGIYNVWPDPVSRQSFDRPQSLIVLGPGKYPNAQHIFDNYDMIVGVDQDKVILYESVIHLSGRNRYVANTTIDRTKMRRPALTTE